MGCQEQVTVAALLSLAGVCQDDSIMLRRKVDAKARHCGASATARILLEGRPIVQRLTAS